MVHDYLTQRGGAERVVLAMLRALPGARLITSVYDADATYPAFRDYHVETTWLQRLPRVRQDPRLALPVLPALWSRHSITDADVVLCSSSGWSHGVSTRAPKLVYCHNPARWIYQPGDYLKTQPRSVRWAFGGLRGPLQSWDRRAAASCAGYLANSSTVQGRIARAYGLEAKLLPPPVGVDPTGSQSPVEGIDRGYFLVVGRARGYKNTAVVCEAFRRLTDQRLVVVGGLPEGDWPSHLQGVTDISDDELRWLYANCAALVAASYEDFGLTPLEANAFGRPALCLRAGGYLDTLEEDVSGLWIEELSVAGVRSAALRSLSREWDADRVRQHAANYSEARFAERLRAHVDELAPG